MKRIIQIPAKPDETAIVIAQHFNCTDRYVRLVVNGYTPKSAEAKQKAIEIRKTYLRYKRGKERLINNILNSKKVA
jgi:hypothetical protein